MPDGERRQKTWLGPTVSRRSILTTTPLAAIGGLGLAACTPDNGSTTLAEGDVRAPARPPLPPSDASQTLRFFTAEEARAVEAVVARLVPGDGEEPGAVEAGVVVYIDAKLAQFEAFPDPAYHAPPFADPEGGPGTIQVDEDQLYRYGYQSPLTPREVYHLGVPALDRYSQTRFGSLFHLLDDDQKDRVLQVLDGVQQRGEQAAQEATGRGGGASGDDGGGGQDGVTQEQMDQAEDVFGDVSPGQFFTTLRTDTIEGMFSDPAYGGNIDMVGWMMLGYPGAQRSYSPDEMLHGSARQPQPMHQLTAMNPDRPGGHPALEQHSGEHIGD